MKLLYELVEYVSELTGSEILPEEISREDQEKLPIFISRNFSLHSVNILGKNYVLLIHFRGEIPTPAQAVRYAETVRSKLQAQAVFVFPRLDGYIRKRLIDKGIPFIVPYQHMFLPLALIDIREKTLRGPSFEGVHETLSNAAQVMLLYYLHQPEQVIDWPLKEWASALRYSRMTISRAWRELVAKNLCEGQKRGRSTVLIFPRSKRELWDLALPHLRNPVRYRKSVKVIKESRFKLYRAGLTALAERTLISKGNRTVFAMTLPAWKKAIAQNNVIEASVADESGVVIEIWRYAPSILAQHEQSVDALSLYLSLRDELDERIQGALEIMMEEFLWQK